MCSHRLEVCGQFVKLGCSHQNATKVISNILHCLKHGTQLGWFIDLDERLIIVFLPGQQPIEMIGDDRLLVPEFPKLELTVTQVFGWLKAGKPKGDREAFH